LARVGEWDDIQPDIVKQEVARYQQAMEMIRCAIPIDLSARALPSPWEEQPWLGQGGRKWSSN
jgi:hypothetical protein